MAETMSAFDWMLSDHYARAMNLAGYAHDAYRYRARPNEGETIELDSYVITRNGKRIEPEEIIARLQKLDELEASL